MINVLICEDDKANQNLFKLIFKNEYNIKVVSTGQECYDTCVTNNIDLIVLDLGLPDVDGQDLIKMIRSYSNDIPIIVVSARMDDKNKIEALDSGANDYLVKPFSTLELKARIRNIMRYFKNNDNKKSNIFINGSLKIDFDAHTVYLDDKELKLTNYEYKILSLLAKNIDRTLTHNYIITNVWGDDFTDSNTLRVFMAGIRRKIEKNLLKQEYIRTDIGVGYRMNSVN